MTPLTGSLAPHQPLSGLSAQAAGIRGPWGPVRTPWSPHSGPHRSTGQTPPPCRPRRAPSTLLTAPPGWHPWPCGQSPRAADLQEAPPHPAREARRDGDCGQVLTAPPRRPSSLQVSCTPLPNVSPSLRAHDLSYFLPSFTPEPEPEKSSPGQPATPNSPGGRTPSLLGS